MIDDFERLKVESTEKDTVLGEMQQELQAKDQQLHNMGLERRKQMEEVYEMK